MARLTCLLVCLVIASLTTYRVHIWLTHYTDLASKMLISAYDEHQRDLPFPLVTLCNINPTRGISLYNPQSTSPVSRGLDYELFTDAFQGRVMENAPEAKLDAPMYRLMDRASHRLEDMLKGCVAGQQRCSAQNFTKSVLPTGACYTFRDRTEGFGEIQLTLDPQSYDYMIPNQGFVGFRIILHGRGDPLWATMPGAIYAGPTFHTMLRVVGLRKVYKQHCIPKQHWARCMHQCMQEMLHAKCGCHMSDCTLLNMMRCGIKMNLMIEYLPPSQCECQNPCDQITYSIESVTQALKAPLFTHTSSFPPVDSNQSDGSIGSNTNSLVSTAHSTSTPKQQQKAQSLTEKVHDTTTASKKQELHRQELWDGSLIQTWAFLRESNRSAFEQLRQLARLLQSLNMDLLTIERALTSVPLRREEDGGRQSTSYHAEQTSQTGTADNLRSIEGKRQPPQTAPVAPSPPSTWGAFPYNGSPTTRQSHKSRVRGLCVDRVEHTRMLARVRRLGEEFVRLFRQSILFRDVARMPGEDFHIHLVRLFFFRHVIPEIDRLAGQLQHNDLFSDVTMLDLQRKAHQCPEDGTEKKRNPEVNPRNRTNANAFESASATSEEDISSLQAVLLATDSQFKQLRASFVKLTRDNSELIEAASMDNLQQQTPQSTSSLVTLTIQLTRDKNRLVRLESVQTIYNPLTELMDLIISGLVLAFLAVFLLDICFSQHPTQSQRLCCPSSSLTGPESGLHNAPHDSPTKPSMLLLQSDRSNIPRLSHCQPPTLQPGSTIDGDYGSSLPEGHPYLLVGGRSCSHCSGVGPNVAEWSPFVLDTRRNLQNVFTTSPQETLATIAVCESTNMMAGCTNTTVDALVSDSSRDPDCHVTGDARDSGQMIEFHQTSSSLFRSSNNDDENNGNAVTAINRPLPPTRGPQSPRWIQSRGSSLCTRSSTEQNEEGGHTLSELQATSSFSPVICWNDQSRRTQGMAMGDKDSSEISDCVEEHPESVTAKRRNPTICFAPTSPTENTQDLTRSNSCVGSLNSSTECLPLIELCSPGSRFQQHRKRDTVNTHASPMGNTACCMPDAPLTTLNSKHCATDRQTLYSQDALAVHRTFVISRAVQCNACQTNPNTADQIMVNNHSYHDISHLNSQRNSTRNEQFTRELQHPKASVNEALTLGKQRGYSLEGIAELRPTTQALPNRSTSELSVDVSSLSVQRCSTITPPPIRSYGDNPSRCKHSLAETLMLAANNHDEDIESLSATISAVSSTCLKDSDKNLAIKSTNYTGDEKFQISQRRSYPIYPPIRNCDHPQETGTSPRRSYQPFSGMTALGDILFAQNPEPKPRMQDNFEPLKPLTMDDLWSSGSERPDTTNHNGEHDKKSQLKVGEISDTLGETSSNSSIEIKQRHVSFPDDKKDKSHRLSRFDRSRTRLNDITSHSNDLEKRPAFTTYVKQTNQQTNTVTNYAHGTRVKDKPPLCTLGVEMARSIESKLNIPKEEQTLNSSRLSDYTLSTNTDSHSCKKARSLSESRLPKPLVRRMSPGYPPVLLNPEYQPNIVFVEDLNKEQIFDECCTSSLAINRTGSADNSRTSSRTENSQTEQRPNTNKLERLQYYSAPAEPTERTETDPQKPKQTTPKDHYGSENLSPGKPHEKSHDSCDRPPMSPPTTKSISGSNRSTIKSSKETNAVKSRCTNYPRIRNGTPQIKPSSDSPRPRPPAHLPICSKQSTESIVSAPLHTFSSKTDHCQSRMIRRKFYIPESANIEAILADPDDRRIKAICERFKCDVEIYSKMPWCGFLQYIVVLVARDTLTLRKCARTLDSRLNWCLDAQIR